MPGPPYLNPTPSPPPLQGVFLGTPAEAVSLLQSYGDLLTDLDQDLKQTPSTSDVSAAYPFGLEMQQKDSIYDFYFFVSTRSCVRV
eukprot:19653-Eustigmatos_ZCMA.PRE.1